MIVERMTETNLSHGVAQSAQPIVSPDCDDSTACQLVKLKPPAHFELWEERDTIRLEDFWHWFVKADSAMRAILSCRDERASVFPNLEVGRAERLTAFWARDPQQIDYVADQVQRQRHDCRVIPRLTFGCDNKHGARNRDQHHYPERLHINALYVFPDGHIHRFYSAISAGVAA